MPFRFRVMDKRRLQLAEQIGIAFDVHAVLRDPRIEIAEGVFDHAAGKIDKVEDAPARGKDEQLTVVQMLTPHFVRSRKSRSRPCCSCCFSCLKAQAFSTRMPEMLLGARRAKGRRDTVEACAIGSTPLGLCRPFVGRGKWAAPWEYPGRRGRKAKPGSCARRMLRRDAKARCTRCRATAAATRTPPRRTIAAWLATETPRAGCRSCPGTPPADSGTNRLGRPRSPSYFMISYSRIMWSRQVFQVSCEMRRWS